jgi:DGQHR domain-containing protein
MTTITRGRAARKGGELRLPALEVRQGEHRLYSFAVDGKQLPRFTTVSRVHRDDEAQLQGYQRPEVLAHIASIRHYIESDAPMLPNALVVAFDKRVRFESDVRANPRQYSRPGTLVVPVDDEWPDEDKPGWIVDGQQRCAAIRSARVESFPICVTAFITDSDAEQRAQFILVNSTKPLPKGLIYELLPSTEGVLPTALVVRRFPAYLLDRLNHDDGSPFQGLISTPTTPGGTVKDNSVLKMLENSLSDGALYRYRDHATGTGDVDSMLSLVTAFWRAVSDVFPDAWGKSPRRSRLMHGVGIVSMGFVMDAIAERYFRLGEPTESAFAADLRTLRDVCRWTSGEWEFSATNPRRWNELQNTPKDINLLSNYLLHEYKARAGRLPLGERKEA